MPHQNHDPIVEPRVGMFFAAMMERRFAGERSWMPSSQYEKQTPIPLTHFADRITTSLVFNNFARPDPAILVQQSLRALREKARKTSTGESLP